jgi:hypothetical protein
MQLGGFTEAVTEALRSIASGGIDAVGDLIKAIADLTYQ